jgi:hypothetical protein
VGTEDLQGNKKFQSALSDESIDAQERDHVANKGRFIRSKVAA